MAVESAKAVQRAAKDEDVQKVAAAAAGAAAVAAGAAAGAKIARGRRRSRAYRLKRGETLPDGLRRVALGRIDHAIDELRGKTNHSPDEAVHEARKDMKKLRALLRLARAELGDKVYRAENRTFRDAARRLSGVRDAQVLIETLDALRSRFKKELPRDAVTALRKELVARRRALEADSGGREDAADEMIGVLREARKRVEQWPLEDEAFDAIEPGLRRCYRRGKRRFRDSEEDPTTENLHEWRKRVKDLWHHHQLLEFTWPELMEPTGDQAHELSDLLGEDHDFAVLDEVVGKAVPDADDRAALQKAIRVRRRELQGKAFALGTRLYAEPPRGFTRRIGGWFEAA